MSLEPITKENLLEALIEQLEPEKCEYCVNGDETYFHRKWEEERLRACRHCKGDGVTYTYEQEEFISKIKEHL